jgi:hypothetical protein
MVCTSGPQRFHGDQASQTERGGDGLGLQTRVAQRDLKLDIVPYPTAGNRLTVHQQYQQHWLAVYATKSAGVDTTVGCAEATPTEDGYALPIDRELIATRPRMLDEPHHDYPAIDLLVPVGSPVYAARGGTITRVVDWPYNCWELGRCDQTCGVGISIDGNDGADYIYCHGSQLIELPVGATVTAGQLIMWSGNTGRSRAPHVHFEIRIEGQQFCPQRFLRDMYNSGQAPAPRSLAPTGCTFET